MLTVKISSFLRWVNDAKKSDKPVLTGRYQLAELDIGAPLAPFPNRASDAAQSVRWSFLCNDKCVWSNKRDYVGTICFAFRTQFQGGKFGPIAKLQ